MSRERQGALRDTAPRLLALAARALGWRPHEFWAATPDELAQSLADPARDPSTDVTRADLDTLMERDSDG